MLRSVTSLPRLPNRPRDSHKGTFGKVLIIAGSTGMSGAAILAGLGALRGGAGLVHVACPSAIQPIVAAANPCYLTTPLPCDAYGILTEQAAEPLSALLQTARAVAIGPGLSKSPAIAAVLHYVLCQFHGNIIVDADGLHALKHLQAEEKVPERKIPLICTPHPGEFAEMSGVSVQVVQSDRKNQTLRYIQQHKVIMVLKGHGTIVTDGQRMYVNTNGNAGMAKGGSGDVLTGLIASLASQGLPPLEAAQAAVYLHGSAGDLAAATLGEHAMLPTDLADALSVAFKKYNPNT